MHDGWQANLIALSNCPKVTNTTKREKDYHIPNLTVWTPLHPGNNCSLLCDPIIENPSAPNSPYFHVSSWIIFLGFACLSAALASGVQRAFSGQAVGAITTRALVFALNKYVNIFGSALICKLIVCRRCDYTTSSVYFSVLRYTVKKILFAIAQKPTSWKVSPYGLCKWPSSCRSRCMWPRLVNLPMRSCIHTFTEHSLMHTVPHSYIQSKHFAGIAVMKKGEKQAKIHQTNKHTTSNKQAKTS